ncbi:hypothetical protein [Natrinema gari]|uniref:Uncharacterized protein n=1 Tax=Natrinema gari JCM 14663 TaxID=1230459 RepID=L9ZF49_9EURY|nr:hypothetical protein [Natrinema gari]ELY85055.1 hypothetical protein C486_00315 [Natrinema gari JCM 14663]
MTPSLEDALLSGIPIGVGQLGHCDCCGACLRPNHRVEVLVTIAGTEIDPATTRCLSCARGSIHTKTERSCLLARGRVAGTVDGTGHSQLILSGASVIDRTE